MEFKNYYKQYTKKLNDALQGIDKKELANLVTLMQKASKEDKYIYFIGNGGSACTATHWSNDFSKGLFHNRQLKYKTLALTDNFSWISAVANDIHYRCIFSDQIERLGGKGDLLIAITASGNSENIIDAIKCAKRKRMTTISLVGFDGGEALQLSDHAIHIRTRKGEYGIVEDVQIILNHFICEFLAQ